MQLFFLSFSEGWCGCGTINHHSGSRRSYRLFQTFYELRYLYHDKKASEVQTRSVLFSGPFGLWNMDVHCFCLHWSERCPLLGESLQPLWVAHRGVWGRTGPAGQRSNEWIWDIQQSLVLPGSFYAARMWYFSKVSHLPYSSSSDLIFVYALELNRFFDHPSWTVLYSLHWFLIQKGLKGSRVSAVNLGLKLGTIENTILSLCYWDLLG